MNLSYSKGAISKMMIVNILLVVLIAIAVFVLLTPDDQDKSPQAIATSPAITSKASPVTPSAPVDLQAEIDTLKTQLERETSKLQTMRVKEERIEAIRNASELEATALMETQTAKSLDDTTSQAIKNKAPSKNQVE